MSDVSLSAPINMDVKEQAFSEGQKGIAIAGNYGGTNAIGEYANIPQSGSSILTSENGNINFSTLPTGDGILRISGGQLSVISIPSGDGIIRISGGQLSVISTPSGDGLKLLNNSLGWTDTAECNNSVD